MRGFKTLKTAYATIKGVEVMRALRKGQARMFALQDGVVGEARIPEAVAWPLDYLQPFEGSLFRLRESGHASQHPDAMLDLVDTVVGPNGLPAQHRPKLREILEEMREARPAVATDPRFQRLFEIATQ